MAADWDVSGMHERRVDERIAPEPRRGWLGSWFGGRRRLAGVLTGIVSVAIIAGYIWSGRDRADPGAGGEPPLIQADEAPVRVPPEEPGGMDIPHRDKLVLQRVPGAEEDPRRERLLPPPEEPLPPPREEPVASDQPARESLPPPTPPHERSAEEHANAPAARPGTSSAQKPPARSEPAPAKTAAPPAQARADGPRPLIPQAQQPVQQSAPQRSSGGSAGGSDVWPSDDDDAPPPQEPAGSAGRSPQRPTESTTSSVLPPATSQPAPARQGMFLVQLAAVSTADQAQAAWSRLKGNNGDLLAGLSPSYARADLGGKGVVYRLRAGPVQGETRARALCAQLAGRKVDCMVVRAGG